MSKSYDYEAAQAGLQQLKVNLESILVQANTFISTVLMPTKFIRKSPSYFVNKSLKEMSN